MRRMRSFLNNYWFFNKRTKETIYPNPLSFLGFTSARVVVMSGNIENNKLKIASLIRLTLRILACNEVQTNRAQNEQPVNSTQRPIENAIASRAEAASMLVKVAVRMDGLECLLIEEPSLNKYNQMRTTVIRFILRRKINNTAQATLSQWHTQKISANIMNCGYIR